MFSDFRVRIRIRVYDYHFVDSDIKPFGARRVRPVQDGDMPIDQSEPSDQNRTAGVYPKRSPSVPTAAIYEPRESETVQ